jgi:hypothetical protein
VEGRHATRGDGREREGGLNGSGADRRLAPATRAPTNYSIRIRAWIAPGRKRLVHGVCCSSEIASLGDEIAELSAHLEAATARLLDRIREFDLHAGWNNGFRSCAAWLSWRVGLDLGAARERVRVARALGTLPRLAAALGCGEISYSRAPAPPGQSVLEDGVRVSAETSQRLSCDAARMVMSHDADGRLVEIGARTRTIPPALRRALQHRDGGCRFPGCGVRIGEGHHIHHWAQGGPTTLSNLAILCRRHHRAVHEEGFQIERGADGVLTFRTPLGWSIPDVPDPPVLSRDPMDVIWEANLRHRIYCVPDSSSPSPRLSGR